MHQSLLTKLLRQEQKNIAEWSLYRKFTINGCNGPLVARLTADREVHGSDHTLT